MTIGLGVLRLAPAAFWTMTPREFARAVDWLMPTPPRPTRNDLSRLMQSFPDQK